MRYFFNNKITQNKDFVYEESFWTGKKTLTYNGVKLNKLEKNVFEYSSGETNQTFVVKGNLLTGLKILMFGKELVVEESFKWQDWLFGAVIFILGLIAGFLGLWLTLCLGYVTMLITKKYDNWHSKLLPFLVMLVCESLVLCYLSKFIV